MNKRTFDPKYTRGNMRWTVGDDKAIEGLTKFSPDDEILTLSVKLGRSPKAIRSRVWYRDQQKINDKSNGGEPEPAAVKILPPRRREEEGLDLVIWFCREAYLEGHEIVIPVLGASFKRKV